MKQRELLQQLAVQAGITKAEAELVLEALIEQLTMALARGDRVNLLGFGSFERSWRKSRQGRNPATGAPIEIAGHYQARFKPAQKFKDSLTQRSE
ncbi:HU family DNA-binding protein [Agaribacterium haliotis]|uniref:HU family DNA-binding protein n=1 Tax=Agaribacterium haliotis TaxID=2013869 RepID=UPI00195A0A0D|nr:HU family DNA-binding protein [Agaribacterium haliotis]